MGLFSLSCFFLSPPPFRWVSILGSKGMDRPGCLPFERGGVGSIERRSNHVRRRHNSSGRCVDATMAERNVDVERRGRGGTRRKETET